MLVSSLTGHQCRYHCKYLMRKTLHLPCPDTVKIRRGSFLCLQTYSTSGRPVTPSPQCLGLSPHTMPVFEQAKQSYDVATDHIAHFVSHSEEAAAAKHKARHCGDAVCSPCVLCLLQTSPHKTTHKHKLTWEASCKLDIVGDFRIPISHRLFRGWIDNCLWHAEEVVQTAIATSSNSH